MAPAQEKSEVKRQNKPVNQYKLAKQINATILFHFHNREKLIVVNALLNTRAMGISLIRQCLFKSDKGLKKESVPLQRIQS